MIIVKPWSQTFRPKTPRPNQNQVPIKTKTQLNPKGPGGDSKMITFKHEGGVQQKNSKGNSGWFPVLDQPRLTLSTPSPFVFKLSIRSLNPTLYPIKFLIVNYCVKNDKVILSNNWKFIVSWIMTFWTLYSFAINDDMIQCGIRNLF